MAEMHKAEMKKDDERWKNARRLPDICREIFADDR